LTENRLNPLKDLDSFKRCLKENPDENTNAAVAILMRAVDDDLEVFLVKRAEVEGDPWSGDMAFPGGKKTAQDNGVVDTAVREVMEETGINLRGLEPLGYLEPLFSWVRNTFSVQPILYLFEGDPPITLNYELTKYMWTPMNDLREYKSRAVVKGFDSPIYRIGDDVVWGLTYRMLERLMEALGKD
jgi:8-oxo-dGTP pyrophosphatase MutT (NUDIX family)